MDSAFAEVIASCARAPRRGQAGTWITAEMQQAYQALRDLTNAAWFADPEAWSAIGYPGPQAVQV